MDKVGAQDRYDAAVKKRLAESSELSLHGRWDFVCRDKEGNIKWTDFIENRVVNVGLDYALDAALSGGAAITSWFIGLTDGTPTDAAGDTMASHAGWVEVTAYDEAARVAWSDGGVSSQSCSNSASPATFTISTNSTTIGGAFLTSDNTKSGTAGTLFSVGAFSAGDKTLDDNDTLDVTATYTVADA